MTTTKHLDTPTRDHHLDIYRGCAMIYIVSIIHTLTASIGLDWYTHHHATLLLFVMPVIFYISGAAYTLSPKKSYSQYLCGRIRRIFTPLIAYIAIYLTYSLIAGHITLRQLPHTALRLCIEIATGKPTQLTHLWFIHTYIIIALLLPILHHLSLRINHIAAYLLLIASMIVSYLYPNYIIGYLIPTFAGLYYKRNKPYHPLVIITLMVAATLLCLHQGYTWNMQVNKFPPNLLYIAYTTTILLLLSKPLTWLCRHIARIPIIQCLITQYATHGYTIYLYHIHIIALIATAYHWLAQSLSAQLPFLATSWCAAPAISIATLLAMATVGKATEYIRTYITRITTAMQGK